RRPQALGTHVYSWRLDLSGNCGFASGDDSSAACHSKRRDRSAERLQPPTHDAWHRDGVPGRDANPDRILQLPGSINDRRARPGIPAAQCIRLLALAVRWFASVLQLRSGRRSLRRWKRTRRRVVRVCALDRTAFLTWLQHRLLDSQRVADEHWLYRHRHQHTGYHLLRALRGYDTEPDAGAGMDGRRRIISHLGSDASAFGRAGDAAARPLRWSA